jgi:hypothetical protein
VYQVDQPAATAVNHTHALTIAGSVLTKRYVSWDRGEHRREWTMLGHIHRHAPDLVPRPLRAALDTVPPAITMSVVPGEPLDGTFTREQVEGLAVAVAELWSVPCDRLPATCGWSDDLRFARRLTAGPRPANGVTAAAHDAALAWWDGPDPALLRTEPEAKVVGHRDPNLANYLWDGHRVRIVDFEDAAVSDPATELALLANTCQPVTWTRTRSARVSTSTSSGFAPLAGSGRCSGCACSFPAVRRNAATRRAPRTSRPGGCSACWRTPEMGGHGDGTDVERHQAVSGSCHGRRR